MDTHNGIALVPLVLSGVQKGCLLSGSLFAIAIDPLLHMLRIQIQSSSLAWARACADDIGTAMIQSRHLPKVRALFDPFNQISDLSLEAVKCITILNSVSATPDNWQALKERLKIHCP